MSAADPTAYFTEVAARHPRCFWLDGGGAREWSGRRSLVGWLGEDDVSLTYDASRREVSRHVAGRSTVVGDDVFAALEAELADGDSSDQWFGCFGYASRPDLAPATVGTASSARVPDAVWMRPGHVRMFDHPEPDRAAAPPTDPSGQRREPDRPAGPAPDAYAAAFAEVQEQLHAGNSYEVNLTYRLDTWSDLPPAEAYLRLRSLNPAPYAGFLQHDVAGARGWLLSSSPERYALVDPDGVLETKPIKGTTPRGQTPEADAVQAERLVSEPGFRAENLMIVDLLRNDLATVCQVGTVAVPALMAVESYPTVHQLVSTVRGRLRPEVSTVAALRALFPPGSMTGAPKRRTMEIIDRVEDGPRGVYAGAFGWIAGDGRADLGVVIRSLSTSGDGSYLLGTGGGITVHSDLDAEYAESRWKADRLLRALSPR